jgi:septum formation protein
MPRRRIARAAAAAPAQASSAGGYAIQGHAEALIRQLSGSWSGVVGLPLFETRALLRAAGYPVA